MLRARPVLLASVAACGLLTAASAGASAPHVFGDPAVAHRAPERSYHVVHYKLALHFDPAKGEVFGSEDVLLQPLRPAFSYFGLDSSGLTIEGVTLERARGRFVALPFKADDRHLRIALDHYYGRG